MTNIIIMINYVPGTGLSMTVLQGSYHSPNFTDEKLGTERVSDLAMITQLAHSSVGFDPRARPLDC